jgi:hypothetical protein
MIRNFGLKWDRRCIDWGGKGKGNAGRLMGKGPTSYGVKSQIEVDFRDQVGIYILYDDHEPIYVGQTGAGNQRLFSRLKQHTSDHLSDRWDKFSWFGFRSLNTDGSFRSNDGGLTRQINGAKTLDLIEGLLIQVLEPKLNKQGARWSGIEQYSQLRSGTEALSDRELLETVYRQIKGGE